MLIPSDDTGCSELKIPTIEGLKGPRHCEEMLSAVCPVSVASSRGNSRSNSEVAAVKITVVRFAAPANAAV